MGMAGVLDSSRYRTFLSWELDVGPAEVDAVTLGSHGDTMVPIVSHGQVHDRPLVDLLPGSVLERVAQRTRDAGAEIVSLLGRGSAFHGPGAAIASMVEAIVEDRHEMLPVCAWLSGEYGIRDVFLGVPAVLSRRGVERVVELPLDADELAALRDAATKVAARCADLDRVLAGTR
jgi:malate dehydrogenase